jgi:hypothetical protein
MLNRHIIEDPIYVEFVGDINDGMTTYVPYLKPSVEVINYNDDGTITIRSYDLDTTDELSHPKYRFVKKFDK